MRRGVACLVAALGACADPPPAPPGGPNVLLVVWDTARADRMSLYGHERATTPALDAWARDARVFDDCLSTAPITVSSHAALFTGLLPTESGSSNAHQWLDEGHRTLAEILRDAGYRTYAWSANPHVSAAENFTQGFEVAEHPWDPEVRDEARAIVADKLRGDPGNDLAGRLAKDDVSEWTIKAAGELAERGLVSWLERSDDGRPFFAFVNYMEAHRPLVPPRRLREALMPADDVRRSYELDFSWVRTWEYTFELADIPRDELDVLAGVYDAALLELDGLFAGLLARLDAAGRLDDTVVVLTSDHGEHLGEQHRLDHQFSLYRPLLRVPLVLWYPPAVEAGRDASPVANYDVFPTLLELTGVADSATALPPRSGARSLLAPATERARLAEFTDPFTRPFELVRRKHPEFDPEAWSGPMRSLTSGDFKLVRGPRGTELFRRGDEDQDLSAAEPADRDRLAAELDRWTDRLRPADRDPIPATTDEQRDLLEAVGYAGTED